jgi:hypothetical protein
MRRAIDNLAIICPAYNPSKGEWAAADRANQTRSPFRDFEASHPSFIIGLHAHRGINTKTDCHSVLLRMVGCAAKPTQKTAVKTKVNSQPFRYCEHPLTVRYCFQDFSVKSLSQEQWPAHEDVVSASLRLWSHEGQQARSRQENATKNSLRQSGQDKWLKRQSTHATLLNDGLVVP